MFGSHVGSTAAGVEFMIFHELIYRARQLLQKKALNYKLAYSFRELVHVQYGKIAQAWP